MIYPSFLPPPPCKCFIQDTQHLAYLSYFCNRKTLLQQLCSVLVWASCRNHTRSLARKIVENANQTVGLRQELMLECLESPFVSLSDDRCHAGRLCFQDTNATGVVCGFRVRDTNPSLRPRRPTLIVRTTPAVNLQSTARSVLGS